MSNKRIANVKFEYFQAFCVDDDTGLSTLFDIQGWIMDIEAQSHCDRVHTIGETRGRLESVRFTGPHKFYAIDFMRMDDVSDAYVVTEDNPAEHIDLNEDEYLGRSTAVIYDPNYHILMIQKNRGGHSAAAIQSYINATSQNGLCILRPIADPVNFNRFDRKRIKKLEVHFANVRNCKEFSSRYFEQIISAMNSTEALSGVIQIGMGYNRTDSLNRDIVYEMVKDVQENWDGISSAKITLADEKQTAVYDLLENLAYDTIKFDVPPHGSLRFDVRSDSMDEKYFLSRNRLLKSLGVL